MGFFCVLALFFKRINNRSDASFGRSSFINRGMERMELINFARINQKLMASPIATYYEEKSSLIRSSSADCFNSIKSEDNRVPRHAAFNGF